jgi:hydrogenase maturation protein HypF
MKFKKIKLPFKMKKTVLALGSQAKNTVCFASGSLAFMSPVHLDLSRPLDLLCFEKIIKYFLKKCPKIIAYDLHPGYSSTKYVQKLRATRYELRAIQHHHAHIASCMADNGLKNQKVIGVAFDGTGLGSDNNVWGAEFLVCDYKGFIRKAHLREIPLLGGERAILEPWRVAAIWLYLIYKESFLELNISFVKSMDKGKWKILKDMYLAGVNSPSASSMGRLFDAVASLILEKPRVNFDAELAAGLEKIAMPQASCFRPQASYPFQIVKSKDEYIINPLPVFKDIIKDLKAKVPRENIAYGFHSTVAQMVKRTCLALRKEAGINKIVLSGGVFQNKLLLRLVLDLLYRERFMVFVHNGLSCNDSGISLGQVIIAGF